MKRRKTKRAGSSRTKSGRPRATRQAATATRRVKKRKYTRRPGVRIGRPPKIDNLVQRIVSLEGAVALALAGNANLKSQIEALQEAAHQVKLGSFNANGPAHDDVADVSSAPTPAPTPAHDDVQQNAA